ncbi:MAG: putative lipid II flippase FtsW [Endomicrobium sp.]|jgi:cell division protein FtsW|nr:putative lipid II flippase FtsW [Endomicrobium sp.]
MLNFNSKKYDYLLMLFMLSAVLFGAYMVFSSSTIMADLRWASPYRFFIKHLILSFMGLAAMCVTAFLIDYKFYQKYARLIYAAAFIAVVAVLIFGVTKGGAKRWFDLGYFTVQPSEIAKIAVVIFIADYIARKKDAFNTWKGFLAPIVMFAAAVIPIAKEPDLGTPVLIAAVFFSLLFCAGIKMRWILGMFGAGITFVALEIIRKPYRLTRFKVYLDSVFNIDNVLASSNAETEQVKQSLQALGSGGLFGRGFGKGEIKIAYLSEPHTDFIFAIIGEELGFVMSSLVLAFFIYILYKGIQISKNAPDEFARYLALGITLLIVYQAFINLSVAVGNLPAKGMTLPFISSGGTSLIVNMAVAGILINLSQYGGKKARNGK